MVWIATAVIGSAVVGGIVSSNASSKAAGAANKATDAASAASAAQLAFDKQVYNDQKPLTDRLGLQAVATNDQQQQIAKDTAARSATAWQQNQQATQGSVGQMGLNALGAQYLSPEQTQELIKLQSQLSAPTSPGLQMRIGTKPSTPITPATAESRAAAQARIAELQKIAETNAVGLEQAKGAAIVNTTAGQGAQVQGAYDANAAATKGIGADIASGLVGNAKTFADQQIGLGEADAQAAIGNADQIGGQYQAIAKQRAADNELRATTQTNADIASAAGQSQRELLRLGGDPNKLAAMSAQIQNGQQLARIGSGNQVAATNIANVNAADDKALSLKSSALDTARQSRTSTQQLALGMNATAAGGALQATTGAAQSAADKTLTGATQAQGITFAGQNAATNINNAAKDKVDANLNSLQQGAANFGAGFANTSGQNAQTSVAAGTAGVTNLNTAVQAPVPLANTVNSGFNSAVSAANVGLNGATQIQNAGAAAGSTIAGIGGMVGGAIPGLSSLFKPAVTPGSDPSAYGGSMNNPSAYIASSKKVKTNRKPVDPDAALEGLESALPQSYDYKPGMGPPGKKIGAMAEDMNEEFGEATAPGGKAINVQNMIGLQHAAIVSLSRKVSKLEKRKA